MDPVLEGIHDEADTPIREDLYSRHSVGRENSGDSDRHDDGQGQFCAFSCHQAKSRIENM